MGVQEGGDLCIPMADSCWYLAETNKTLQSNYLSIRKWISKKNIGKKSQDIWKYSEVPLRLSGLIGGMRLDTSIWNQFKRNKQAKVRNYKTHTIRTCLALQWLRLPTAKAGDLGSTPGQGTSSDVLQKILHATTKIWHSQISKIKINTLKKKHIPLIQILKILNNKMGKKQVREDWISTESLILKWNGGST